MLSNSEMKSAQTNLIDTEEGKKLSLRLAGLKIFTSNQLVDRKNLTQIDLRNNRLTQLPEQLCDLPNLFELKLDYNFLGALPNAMYKL